MYKISDFLELYKSLERWAEAKYGEEGVKAIEENHHNKIVQNDVRYFRKIRNVLTHNPNGSSKPLIELTDEFKERFETLCNKLMDKVVPTINVMKEKSFSYVPVMNGKKVWGVFSESAIFNLVGDGNISLIDEELPLFKIGKYITEYTKNGFFDFVGSNASIDDIRRVFSDAINKGRRLDVIYITTTGDNKGDLVGLVTVWDISSL